MTNAIYAAVCGLHARQNQLDTTSRNIANANTRDYQPLETTLAESTPGVRAEVRRFNTPGPQVQVPPGSEPGTVEMSNVELAREVPNLLDSERGFEANLKTIQTLDEMLGALLDLTG